MKRRAEQMERNLFLLKLGGWAGIASGTLLLATVGYTLAMLGPTGYFGVIEEQSRVPAWVSEHGGLYRYQWLLLFSSQFVLLPLPFALEENFRSESAPAGAWLRMGSVLGSGAIVMAMLSTILYLGLSPAIADAWVQAGTDTAKQHEVVQLNHALASVGTMTRVFSQLLTGTWLFIVAVVIFDDPIGGVTRWTVMIAAVVSVGASGVKVFDQSTPLEMITPFAIAAASSVLGRLLLLERRRGIH